MLKISDERQMSVMHIKTPFIEKIDFTRSEEDISLTARDAYGNRVDVWIDKASGDETIAYGYKLVYVVGKEYEQEERYEKDPSEMTNAQLLDDLTDYAEYLFDMGYEMRYIAQPEMTPNKLAVKVQKRTERLGEGETFRIRDFPRDKYSTDITLIRPKVCDVFIKKEGTDFARCTELPVETLKKDMIAIYEGSLPFVREGDETGKAVRIDKLMNENEKKEIEK